ncbi:kinesin-like protein Klp98A [Anopheles darlingi]|uniref:kinesin-like protein Klp98A n=1 Tax=Anopheles darlingi TaxID=43151 RepID=UPI0021000874|nr:kinesin-like protein Klp98A [Anopheles darlingi]XP_049531777.1 kinesin-like protein Klp98A [Anopheles darlingi]
MASLKVAVRVRPFNQREHELGAKLIVQMDGKKTRLLKPKLGTGNGIRVDLASRAAQDPFNDFTFDHSYWSVDERDAHFTPQDTVFEDLGTEIVDCAFQGYNACVFAYGQTGSGKTFTMMGTAEAQGLIPRICRSLFGRMKLGLEEGTGYKTQCSYLEIYNERVKDLLGPSSAGHGLRVREHRSLGPYVENLSQHPVSDYAEIQNCMIQGNIQRTTASTNMNDTSSRSHAIFTITFVQARYLNGLPSETVSKIHLVDLAGSERANATGATGQRLKEGAHINKSLVTLGSVISALAEQTNPTNNKRVLYIPYRDSILTWLLKDSLGGNSKTIMIAAISPADVNYSETLSTLRYANRAKNIINKPTINEDPNVKLIRELRDEIYKLKLMISSDTTAALEPSLKVLEDLHKKEAQEKVLTEEWTEKWREAQSILREQKSLGLRKSGVGVVLDSEMPHLIGIHDDISTGVTLYSLKEGETTIGTDEASQPQDIILNGIGIAPEHCRIVLSNGNATIYPNPNATCLLNACIIEVPTAISQGDILLLGRTNMFRYNNPAEAAKLRQESTQHQRSSRLDLSRLSLIAASRENLCASFMSDDDGGNSPFGGGGGGGNMGFSTPQATLRFRQYTPSRDEVELQDEHRKILQTIENALRQLNLERTRMHEQFKNKIKLCTEELERLESTRRDKLMILDCRIGELMARREMVLWEKSNEKTQVDISVRQLSALQTQLDTKKRDFYEYVAKELQELQDCGRLDEASTELIRNAPQTEDYSEILLQISRSLDNYSQQYIREFIRRNRDDITKYEKELSEKETQLAESTQKIADLDSKIQELEQQNKDLLQQRTEQELLQIQEKKRALTLELRHQNGNETGDSDHSDDLTVNSRALETCDTFHTANSDCSFGSALTTPALGSLNHSLIPTPSSTEDGSAESDTADRDYEEATSNVGHPDELVLAGGGIGTGGGMSDSGVSFETNKQTDAATGTILDGDVGNRTEKLLFQSDDHCLLLASSSTPATTYGGAKQMPTTTTIIVTDRDGSGRLKVTQSPKSRRKSTDSEDDGNDRTTLTATLEGSNRLKLPSKNRKSATNSLRTESFDIRYDIHPLRPSIGSSTRSGTDEDDDEDEQRSRGSSLDNSSITSSTANLILCEMNHLRESIASKKVEIMKILETNGDTAMVNGKIGELQELQKRIVQLEVKIQEVEKSCLSDGEMHHDSMRDFPGSFTDSDDSRVGSGGNSCIYPAGYIRDTSIYAPSVTRSLPSMEGTYRSDHLINIPTYIIRGAGKQTHYEYEVKINLPEERWTLLRRYSRFRELHLAMKKQYGDKIATIPFPRRELFASNTESVAKTRRRQLETYLRRLLVVCAKIPHCPIYEGEGRPGLTKQTLIEFHSFFKKGLFETGKHGTG